MSASPWYVAGLRFGCRRCGACCTGAPGYVWLQPEDIVSIADCLGVAPPAFLARQTRRVDGALSLREESDGRCILYEVGRGCRAYAVRPRQCRTWPFWARIIATPESWEREAADCPGMGAGELIGAETIESLAQSPARPRQTPA